MNSIPNAVSTLLKVGGKYFLRVDLQYLEQLYEPHNDLYFLPERKKSQKVEKLAAYLHDEKQCVIHRKKIIKSPISFVKCS